MQLSMFETINDSQKQMASEMGGVFRRMDKLEGKHAI